MFDSDKSSRAGVATIDGGDRLLARLQELESSHRKQQELLLREQMRQKEMLAEHRERVVGFRLSSPDMQTPLEDRTNPSGSSDPSGSGDDEKRQKRRVDTKTTSRLGNKFDENATVCGAAVPFQYLVDQKLKEDTAGAKSTSSTTPKSQPRKYLKRGEGLKRFGEQFAKPRWNQRSAGEQKGTSGSRAVAVRRQVEVDRPKASNEVAPARKPRESTESEIKEKTDLRAFEILEEAAEDSSFCSSASFVERLLIRQEKFTRRQKPLLEEDEHEESEISSRSVLSSSPLPPPVALQEEWHSCRSRVMKDLDDYLRTFDWVRGEVPNLEKDVKAAIGFETEDDQTSTFDSPEKARPVHPHVRFNEMVQKLTFPSDSRVEESSVNCESETEVESESDFGGRSDEVVVEDSAEVVEVRRPEVKPKTKVTPRKTQAAGRFRPAVFRPRLARRKPKASAPKAKPATKKPPVQVEEPPKSEDLDLIARAEQLNREMGIFRRENERVLALRRQLEVEKRKVQQTREKLTQDTVEQSKAMQKRLREEEDKLKRDRLAFEKFRREQKYAGDGKLQEEIRLLKLQLQDMEAELKEKDAKFGSAQSRYKMSLRKLENANDEMRAQVSKLEAENEKLKRQVAVLKNPKETTAAQKLTRQIHDVNDLISKTFFKNPGTTKKPANEQPLRGLLKKSPSESVHVEQNITMKPARSKSFGAEHEIQLREQSKKVEERLLKEAEEESCDTAAKDVGKTKVSKFPRIAAKEAEKVVDFREEPTRLASFDVSSEELRDFRPPTRSTEDKEKPNPPKSSSNLSHISEASETSVSSALSKSTEASNRFFESEVVRGDGTIERTLADGRKECVFPNGNRKVVSPNGKCVKIVYYNGDVQEKFEDGTVEYFFAESRTWHTTKPDGTEIIELPSGEVQTRKSDGDVEVIGSDGLKVVQKPNGTKIAWQPNGTRVETKITGERTIHFPNGEQEVQTSDFKKRVYVDGTEKIVYSDGRQETRYSNGRLRIRDSRGNLVVDCFA